MKYFAIEGNTQCLDGGAMFGNAPKAMWQQWCKPDDDNRINLATRALLVEYDDGKTALFEAGVGAFFDPKMKDRFAVQETEHVLIENLEQLGCPHDTIDYVILSHLHFDHAGGILSAWEKDKPLSLLFPQAEFFVSETQWQRAKNPHARDRASYIPEMIELLEKSGRLFLVEGETHPVLQGRMRFHYSEGHTPGLMLAEIDVNKKPMVFCSDLIPGMAWVHHAITMGYDRYPEQVIDEKIQLLNQLIERKGSLFFTHDEKVCRAIVEKNEKGRFVPHAVALS
jgi:glyoxylase-like metal-dependent hydrolase (beta-lactamase superfamily II)